MNTLPCESSSLVEFDSILMCSVRIRVLGLMESDIAAIIHQNFGLIAIRSIHTFTSYSMLIQTIKQGIHETANAIHPSHRQQKNPPIHLFLTEKVYGTQHLHKINLFSWWQLFPHHQSLEEHTCEHLTQKALDFLKWYL